MKTPEEVRPARAVAPGRILRRELEARGWTQRDLAQIMGRPQQAISQLVQGKKQITPETALELSQALGTSAELWMNLESAYRLSLAGNNDKATAISRRSKLYGLAPVAELIRRGWLPADDDVDRLEGNLLAFLGLDMVDRPAPLAGRLRCSQVRRPDERALVAWLRRAELLASEQPAARYSREALEHAIPHILALAESESDVREIPNRLRALGVRYTVVPHLERTYVDGAVLHAEDRPVVVQTLRLDRIDNYWFTLMHELAHLVAGHRGTFIDEIEGEEIVRDARERDADALATDWLIPQHKWERFLAESGGRYRYDDVIGFAYEIERHPGIVVGRLHHEGLVHFRYLRQALPKASPWLKPWVDRALA